MEENLTLVMRYWFAYLAIACAWGTVAAVPGERERIICRPVFCMASDTATMSGALSCAPKMQSTFKKSCGACDFSRSSSIVDSYHSPVRIHRKYRIVIGLA